MSTPLNNKKEFLMAIQSPRQKNIIYSDFRSDFKKNPFSNDLIVITNEQSVIQSIRKIVNTNYYEIPYNPYFGANIRKKLFENFTPQMQTEIVTEITFAINDHEPRANIISVEVDGSPDSNLVNIIITFSLINSSEQITITETLTRVR
jgi:phage baseplate assembly protein W